MVLSNKEVSSGSKKPVVRVKTKGHKMTVDEFVKMVVSNAKTKRWVNCTVPVEYGSRVYGVGIKAFGLWVQRVEVNGVHGDVNEHKTQKGLTAELTATLTGMLARQGETNHVPN